MFHWDDNNTESEQMDHFLQVVSNGKHKTIIIFLDSNSSSFFLRQVYAVKQSLPEPCIYQWIFYNLSNEYINILKHLNASVVCWRAFHIKNTLGQDKEKSEYSVIGPRMDRFSQCVLQNTLSKWSNTAGFQTIRPLKVITLNFENRILNISIPGERTVLPDLKSITSVEDRLISLLKEKLNFRTRLAEPQTHDYGRELPNGSWTGSIGYVRRGVAIFCVASQRSSRMRVIDYTTAFAYGRVAFITRNPALESRDLVLFMPLTVNVWCLLLLTIFVGTLILFIITHLLQMNHAVKSSYNFWFIVGTLGNEGVALPVPSYFSLRIFVTFWWIFVTSITASYSGVLTYFMLYPGRLPAVDTIQKLQDALLKGKITYGTTKGTAYVTFLKRDMGRVNLIFRDSLVKDNLVGNLYEGVERALQEKYAFVEWGSMLTFYAAYFGKDKFTTSKDSFSTDSAAVVVPKCHPCRPSFDQIISHLFESGVIMKWEAETLTKAALLARHTPMKEIRALSLDDLQGAFIFLGLGIAIGSVALVVEQIAAAATGKILSRKNFKKNCGSNKAKMMLKKKKRNQKINPIIVLI